MANHPNRSRALIVGKPAVRTTDVLGLPLGRPEEDMRACRIKFAAGSRWGYVEVISYVGSGSGERLQRVEWNQGMDGDELWDIWSEEPKARYTIDGADIASTPDQWKAFRRSLVARAKQALAA